MTTSVDLPDGLEEAVDSELKRGYYASKSDLIRDAIRRLLEERGIVEKRTLSAKARESIRRGRTSDISYSESEIKEMHDIRSE